MSYFQCIPSSSLYSPPPSIPSTVSFYHHHIPPDNSCLFTCLSYYTPYLTKHSHSLRKQIISYLEKHKAEYEFYIIDESFRNYLKKLKKNAWGSDLEIRVFLDMMLKVENIGDLLPNIKEIRVYDEMRGTEIKFEGNEAHSKVIHLLYKNGNHYDLLWDQEEYEKRTLSQDVLYGLIDDAVEVAAGEQEKATVSNGSASQSDHCDSTKPKGSPTSTTTLTTATTPQFQYRNLHYERWLKRGKNNKGGGNRRKTAFPQLGGGAMRPAPALIAPFVSQNVEENDVSTEAPPANPWGQSMDWGKTLTAEESATSAEEESQESVEVNSPPPAQQNKPKSLTIGMPSDAALMPNSKHTSEPTTTAPQKLVQNAWGVKPPLHGDSETTLSTSQTPQSFTPPAHDQTLKETKETLRTQENKPLDHPQLQSPYQYSQQPTSAPPQPNRTSPQMSYRAPAFVPTASSPQAVPFNPHMMPPPPHHFMPYPPHAQNGGFYAPSGHHMPMYAPQYMMSPPQAYRGNGNPPPPQQESYRVPPLYSPSHPQMPPQQVSANSTGQPSPSNRQNDSASHKKHHGRDKRYISNRGRGRGRGRGHHQKKGEQNNNRSEQKVKKSGGNHERRSAGEQPKK